MTIRKIIILIIDAISSLRRAVASRCASARAIAATVFAAGACCAAVALWGCNIVGPIAYTIGGPPKTDAAHELDPSASLVVFVDDRASRAPRRSLRSVLAKKIEQTLIEKQIVAADRLFPNAAATRAAQGETYDAPVSIAEVGRRVGADLILYVEMTGWGLTADGVSLAPQATAEVKVIEAATGDRVFPEGGKGVPVSAKLQQGGVTPSSPAARAQLEQSLAQALGAQIAKLFFEHEKDTLSGRLGD